MGPFINRQQSTEQRVDDHEGRFKRSETQYQCCIASVNPKRIVPLGPIIDFNAAHGCARFN
jgi:glutathionyl-hydroquinone reductase